MGREAPGQLSSPVVMGVVALPAPWGSPGSCWHQRPANGFSHTNSGCLEVNVTPLVEFGVCGTFTFDAIFYLSVYTQYTQNIQLILPEQQVL